MTLGARPRDIFLEVIREGAAVAGIGIALGSIAAAGAGQLLARSLFGISPTDPPTFVAAGLLLFLFTILACYLPARRAVRVDPAAALRCG
jgi:putative ABC transport system permease protein